MKCSSLGLIVGAAMLMAPLDAWAIFQDVDTRFGGQDYIRITEDDEWSSDFNVRTDDSDGTADTVGYVPGTAIWKVDIWFNISDDSDSGSERVEITFDFPGYLGSDWVWKNDDPVMNYAATFNVGDSGSVGTLLLDVWLDGILKYEVDADDGDFRLYEAGMRVWLESERPTGNSVPDGGSSVLLLGLALVGIGALCRKLGLQT
jgi:hypothetical protein